MSIPLDFWIILWKVVLIGGVVLFGCMAVWVTIGGAFDVRRLFQRLRQAHREDQQAEATETDSSPSPD